jgi:hypothetical protein
VKVSDDKDLASHIDPKPCVATREGRRRSVGRDMRGPAIEPRKFTSETLAVRPGRRFARR